MFKFKNTSLKADFISFSGGEQHIQLSQIPKIKPTELSLRADLTDSNQLLNLLLLDNALTAHYQQQICLNLEIPYLPYARQDRVCAIGQAFSLKLMSQILAGLKIKNLTVWDVHSPVALQLTGAKNIEATDFIAQSPELLSILSNQNTVLVCPDKGAKKRTLLIQKRFNTKTFIEAKKVRDPKTGDILETHINSDDLKGKIALISDDICDGGMTFIKIAEALKAKGVETIILYVTHGIFSRGLNVFEGLIDQIFTTNSFPQQPNKKLTIINFNGENK